MRGIIPNGADLTLKCNSGTQFIPTLLDNCITRLASKTIEIRFVLLLRNEFWHSDQDQTRSGLDRIIHDQGFPNLWRKMAGWGWIFRHEFGKTGQDQTRSGLPKFVTENGWLRVDFPSRIWENWTRSNTIRAGWLRGDFPSQIWEIWTGSDTIRAGWLGGDFPWRIWEIWTGSDTIRADWLGGDFLWRIIYWKNKCSPTLPEN